MRTKTFVERKQRYPNRHGGAVYWNYCFFCPGGETFHKQVQPTVPRRCHQNNRATGGAVRLPISSFSRHDIEYPNIAAQEGYFSPLFILSPILLPPTISRLG